MIKIHNLIIINVLYVAAYFDTVLQYQVLFWIIVVGFSVEAVAVFGFGCSV